MGHSAARLRCSTPVTAGLAAALAFSAQAEAQPARPCRSSDSLLSLGKAAFFRSIERGAFAIGERTLEDLSDGLGAEATSRPSGRGGRPLGTAPALSRAAVLPPESESGVLASLTAYVDSPSSEAADAAFQSFLENATKVLFESLPGGGEAGRVGLVLEGRQLLNRNSTFAVQDMTNERLRLNLEESLFGDGPDLRMGSLNRILSAAPFFKAPVIADARNVDRNNLGIAVRREQDLRALWFDDYRAYLSSAEPSRTAGQITEALNAGWPILQKFWAFKRTEIFVDRAQTAFGVEMRQVNERVTTERLPASDCDTPNGLH
jgi:hypothetical protein